MDWRVRDLATLVAMAKSMTLRVGFPEAGAGGIV